ncbi:hypothetical protein OL548_29210 [Lysinibacillus sp. MHQ-1]|nr:hypothetical protein OL548_29210 [Lysinibacillus sp. MHQ-1]
MQPDEQIGVAILANMNTSSTTAIGQGIMDLWKGKTTTPLHTNSYQKLDKIATIISIIIIGISLIFCYFVIKMTSSIYKKTTPIDKACFQENTIINSPFNACCQHVNRNFSGTRSFTWRFKLGIY